MRRQVDVLFGAAVGFAVPCGSAWLEEHAWFVDMRALMLVIATAIAFRLGWIAARRRSALELAARGGRMLGGAYVGWLVALLPVLGRLA